MIKMMVIESTVLMLLIVCLQLTNGLSITEDIAEHVELDDSSHILFEASDDRGGADALRKRLENFLEKPTQIWNVPNELSSHPSTCEQYTYCQRDDRPPAGVYRRLPIYPWWYYSCDGEKVKCQPCPSTEDLDHPTLFFSETCQQCISEYKDETIRCPDKNNKDDKKAEDGWRSLVWKRLL